MVISFPFTFKSPAFRNYVSASSLSKPSKFLILQFLEKCYKFHSAFKILSKSHVLDTFLISSVYYKCSYKLWFHPLKEFSSPNLYINWANIMWYPINENKKLDLRMLNSVKGFNLCIKYAVFGTLIINLGKNSICACYCKKI